MECSVIIPLPAVISKPCNSFQRIIKLWKSVSKVSWFKKHGKSFRKLFPFKILLKAASRTKDTDVLLKLNIWKHIIKSDCFYWIFSGILIESKRTYWLWNIIYNQIIYKKYIYIIKSIKSLISELKLVKKASFQ